MQRVSEVLEARETSKINQSMLGSPLMEDPLPRDTHANTRDTVPMLNSSQPSFCTQVYHAYSFKEW